MPATAWFFYVIVLIGHGPEANMVEVERRIQAPTAEACETRRAEVGRERRPLPPGQIRVMGPCRTKSLAMM